MTQALLNNLNNIYEGISSPEKPALEGLKKNFDKILDLKTLKKDVEEKLDLKPVENIVPDNSELNNLDSLLSQEDISKFAELQKFCEVSEDKTESEETFGEIIINAAIEAITEEAITTDKSDIALDLIDNKMLDTITKEEPTMQKNLTLEDSTNAEMLINLNLQNMQTIVSGDGTEENETDLTMPAKTEINADSAEEREFTLNLKEDLSSKDKKLDEIMDEDMLEDLNVESVTSETAFENSEQDNFMQNQTSQEQMTKIMIQGDMNFEDSKIETVTSDGVKTQISPDKILEQITKQMEGMYNSSKVNIVLNPESLGRITLQLINSKDGLSAQFFVTNEEVRNLLMKGLSELKDNLISQGISVDNVNVKLSETEMQKEDSSDEWTEQEGSKGGNKEQNSKQQKQDKKQFEQTMFEINNENI